MSGWTILFAFLTFVAFIALLIGGTSWAMGFINKDRGWTVFGLKVMVVALLAVIVGCVLIWR
ncbi:hypothetical protein A4H97_03575 [Niastella yeongjuensis]|uniref:Uncharacterized protein n=1 Tax=Niastella yeongjuensis TaxID=354355 RepID=A0A1V9EXS2_9BACT|nr:hypothetical protein [Niastella yeongjuensis]OQP50916.1 hypothetical protein A4H97_03575 [Niastella yeongjuensis]SEN11670.1 hypothetical protein SAMN05660816_00224 [Niastella yeongjuensis]